MCPPVYLRREVIARRLFAMSIEDDVRGILADNRKTDDRVRALLSYIEGFSDVYSVAVRNTHAAVETVWAYGLVIGVDGNGHASEVTFPDGAVRED